MPVCITPLAQSVQGNPGIYNRQFNNDTPTLLALYKALRSACSVYLYFKGRS